MSESEQAGPKPQETPWRQARVKPAKHGYDVYRDSGIMFVGIRHHWTAAGVRRDVDKWMAGGPQPNPHKEAVQAHIDTVLRGSSVPTRPTPVVARKPVQGPRPSR